ncbi:MAG: Crp/Fnr family transcriptional regulator [Clostridia bacterium]|nr:Crp/Fnr family transcriptional regulator [Clostridia bacterium]
MLFSDGQIRVLTASPLFFGLTPENVRQFLVVSCAVPSAEKAGQQLVRQGESPADIYIVISGSAVGERLEADGRAVIVNEFGGGSVFGDVLSGVQEKSPVTVTMTADGQVLRLPFSSLIVRTGVDPAVQERVLRNLIGEIAEKYLALQRRLELLLCPSLRSKIAAYLLRESEKRRSAEFELPHSREQQARILGCDRSALSRELSRMKRDGLIDFHRKIFTILDKNALSQI